MSEYTKLDIVRRDIPNYSMASVMDLWKTTEDKVMPMFFKSDEFPTSEDDMYHKVTVVDRYRPDLISFQYYQTVNYIWVILIANSIFDPFDIEIGTVLRIPSQSVISSKWIL